MLVNRLQPETANQQFARNLVDHVHVNSSLEMASANSTCVFASLVQEEEAEEEEMEVPWDSWK